MSWTKIAVIGLVILFAIFIWLSHQVWAAAFLGVLLALSLTGPAQWIGRYIRGPAWLATSGVLVIVLVAMGGLGWLIGAPITSQIRDMATKLPDATEKSVDWLNERPWGRGILQQVEEWSGMSQEQLKDADGFFGLGADADDQSNGLSNSQSNSQSSSQSSGQSIKQASIQAFAEPQPLWETQGQDQQDTSDQTVSSPDSSGTIGASDILMPVSGALAATLRAATLVLVSLVVALFLAFDPRVYERGVIWLVPGRHEAIAHKTMHRLSRALRWWMLGRLTSMTAVGILTSLGMWAIGMPAPMALGAIAGLLSFVPNIGPIAAAVPGLILAVPLGPWMILGAAGVYLGAQLIESNALNPLIAQYAVSVPPGLLIVTQVILATLGGIWGMVIATPLLVVVMTLVQQLYIREGLKDPIEVTGTKPD